MNKVLRVVITGGAGQIGYSIAQPIALGLAFGPEQLIHIVLLDIPDREKVLKGVQIELEDLASPVLQGTTIATTGEVAFKDADFVVCLAGRMALGANITRAMLLKPNKDIYEMQGKLLDQYAKKTCKILVVANPCNTLCLTLSQNAPSIPRENFASMSRLDHNRIKSMIALKVGVPSTHVKGVCVWGNHASTMVPDVSYCTVSVGGKTHSVKDLIKDDHFWQQFTPSIQERAMLVFEYRGFTSALSSAMAAVNHLYEWYHGTPEGEYSSMGVYSDGSYGAPKDVFFSFPCVCKNGKYEIVKGLAVNAEIQAKLKITGDDLLQEKSEAGL